MTVARRVLLVAFISVLCVGPLRASDVTVSTMTAFKSAVGSATAGTHIFVAPGTYTGYIYASDLTGTAANPIKILALDPKNPPIINATGNDNAFYFDACKYMIIDGIQSENANIYTVHVDHSYNVVLRNINAHDVGGTNHTGNNDTFKVVNDHDFLFYGCSVAKWGTGGGSGMDIDAAERGLVMNCTFSWPGLGTGNGLNGFQVKMGCNNMGCYDCTFNNAGDRVLQMGGSSDLNLYSLGNVSYGYEAYQCAAMGNTIINGGASVDFSCARDCVVDYNTIVSPRVFIMRTLAESPNFGITEYNSFSHNLVQYGPVSTQFNYSPSGWDFSKFTFDSNYWYRYDNPTFSIPGPPPGGVLTNSAGGTDPQLDANSSPQYGPAKSYGANAPGKAAAWAQQVNKFQWAWDTAQTYVPHALTGTYTALPSQSVTLDASASTPGQSSYGNYTINTYGWDLNGDGVDEITATTPLTSLTYAQLTDITGYDLPAGLRTIDLHVCVTDEFGKAMWSDYTPTTLQIYLGGDANNDGVVNYKDYIVVEQSFGKSGAGWADGDFDGSGTVDYKDYLILERGFGKTVVPEPATLGLLVLGGWALLKKRR